MSSPGRTAPLVDHPPSSITDHAPLVVDVDGTLVRGDLLWEGLLQLCVTRPRRIPALLPALLRGKAAFKAFVAREAPLRMDAVPLEPETLQLIDAAKAAGRKVILASGADLSHVKALQKRVGADSVWASDGTISLTGDAKLVRIRSVTADFDYIGNDTADMPLWRAARRAYALNPHFMVKLRARHARPDLVVMSRPAAAGIKAIWKAVRPHQWSKNALLFLPALAAHLQWTAATIAIMMAGFVAFSAVASAVYLVNDLVDLQHDRVHEKKRGRPIAAGDLSIPATLALITLLISVALASSVWLPREFATAVAAYMVVTCAYSFFLKKRAILDVLTLAALYAARLVAGAALVSVPMSRWFLGFSVFFFFSLALVKRVVELRHAPPANNERLGGRGYQAADVPVLSSLGAAAACVSSLVYCLYITSGDVGELYLRPDVLWLGLPILLYWQARIWLLTGRGVMNEDPVVFALTDRVSHLLLLGLLITMWLAA